MSFSLMSPVFSDFNTYNTFFSTLFIPLLTQSLGKLGAPGVTAGKPF